MPTVKISDLTELTATPASDDVVVVVDTSTNETKKIKYSNLLKSPVMETPTITGDMNVDNYTLFVDASANTVGFGDSNPSYQVVIRGTGQDTANLTDAGNKGGSLYLQATGITGGSGGALLFGTTFGNQTPFAAIKSYVIDGSTNTIGDLTFSTRNSVSDTSLTERVRIKNDGNIGLGTANPAGRLHISDPSADKGYVFRNGMIDFVNGANSAYSTGIFNATSFYFTGGNVGLGDASPAAKLTARGEVASLAGDASGTGFVVAGAHNYYSTPTYAGAALAHYGTSASGTYFGISKANMASLTFQNSSSGVIGTNGTAPLVFGTVGVERSRIDSNGFHYFNCTTVPSGGVGGVSIDGTASSGNVITSMGLSGGIGFFFKFFGSSAEVGSISTLAGSTTYSTSSDYRLKENVTEMTGSVDRVKLMNPVKFNFIGESRTVDGFLAHEMQDIVPEAIVGEKDAVDDDGKPIYQGIDQSKLVPVLVAAIKELTARIEALESGA